MSSAGVCWLGMAPPRGRSGGLAPALPRKRRHNPTPPVACDHRGVEPPAPFVRDRVTLLADGALAAFAYCLYALGPVLVFLREEFRLSYTGTILHSTVWAGGAVATG